MLCCSGSDKYTPKLPYTEHPFETTLIGSSNQRTQGLTLKRIRHALLMRDVVCVEKVKPMSRASLLGILKVSTCDWIGVCVCLYKY